MTTKTNNSDTQFQQLSDQYVNKPDGYYGLERVEMLKFIPDNANIVLDVGCADGEFGKLLKTQRPTLKVWGVEPHSQAANAASQKLDKVVNGLLEEDMPEFGNQRFDAIIFNDVLEHLISPDKILRICHKYLNESGCIVASIPNILFYPMMREIIKTQDWRYRDHGTLDNTHLRFFTRKSIVRLFEENGYGIKKIEGINSQRCGKLYSVLNTVFYKKLDDWKFLQFAVQAQIK